MSNTGNSAAQGQPSAAADAVADQAQAGKTLATLRARAALAGWTLHSFTDAGCLLAYTLCRWGQSRTVDSLAGVALFLRQVGALE